MMMGTYQINGIDIDPQPVEHEWEPLVPIGHDGQGKPFYPKYTSVTLRIGLDLCGYWWLDDWFAYSVVPDLTLTVPRRSTVDDFQDYTGVTLSEVKEGAVIKQTGMRGVEAVFTGIDEFS